MCLSYFVLILFAACYCWYRCVLFILLLPIVWAITGFFCRLQFMLFLFIILKSFVALRFFPFCYSLSFLYFGFSFRSVYLCNDRLVIKTKIIFKKNRNRISQILCVPLDIFLWLLLVFNFIICVRSKIVWESSIISCLEKAQSEICFPCSLFNVVQYSAFSFHPILSMVWI